MKTLHLTKLYKVLTFVKITLGQIWKLYNKFSIYLENVAPKQLSNECTILVLRRVFGDRRIYYVNMIINLEKVINYSTQ